MYKLDKEQNVQCTIPGCDVGGFTFLYRFSCPTSSYTGRSSSSWDALTGEVPLNTTSLFSYRGWQGGDG